MGVLEVGDTCPHSDRVGHAEDRACTEGARDQRSFNDNITADTQTEKNTEGEDHHEWQGERR